MGMKSHKLENRAILVPFLTNNHGEFSSQNGNAQWQWANDARNEPSTYDGRYATSRDGSSPASYVSYVNVTSWRWRVCSANVYWSSNAHGTSNKYASWCDATTRYASNGIWRYATGNGSNAWYASRNAGYATHAYDGCSTNHAPCSYPYCCSCCHYSSKRCRSKEK